jgi:hypothetical protein
MSIGNWFEELKFEVICMTMCIFGIIIILHKVST